jgi:imidazolonepropionase-like amidohydrolase
MNRFPPAPADVKPVARLRVGWLIDGSGRPARMNVLLTIAGGALAAVEDLPRVPVVPPDCLDYSSCTVLPGLIDGHVHLTMTGTLDDRRRALLRQEPTARVHHTIEVNLKDHLRHGVVAVRDGGGRRGNAARWVQCGGRQAVRVHAAGRAWHRAGRYGGLIGRPVPEGVSLARAIADDPEPCDHVKIVNSGLNSLTEYGRRTAAQFGLEELRAAVRAAAERCRDVMVHANGEEPVRVAVMAGCRSIEHGFFMGRDNLARMAERGTVWLPTAVTMQAYGEHLSRIGRNPNVARRTLDHQLEQLAVARELGVTVALGTDAGAPGVDHGAAVVEEMNLLVQAGYTLEETVRCASINGAGLVGADAGLLQPGRPATLVIAEGPPSALPGGLRRARGVLIDGIDQPEANARRRYPAC